MNEHEDMRIAVANSSFFILHSSFKKDGKI